MTFKDNYGQVINRVADCHNQDPIVVTITGGRGIEGGTEGQEVKSGQLHSIRLLVHQRPN